MYNEKDIKDTVKNIILEFLDVEIVLKTIIQFYIQGLLKNMKYIIWNIKIVAKNIQKL